MINSRIWRSSALQLRGVQLFECSMRLFGETVRYDYSVQLFDETIRYDFSKQLTGIVGRLSFWLFLKEAAECRIPQLKRFVSAADSASESEPFNPEAKHRN